MYKTYISARKLDSLPEGSIIEFLGGIDRWFKDGEKWIVRGTGIPFSAKGLVSYTSGQRFVIVRSGTSEPSS